MQPFSFASVRQLISEVGALGRLGDICQHFAIHKPLVVTDPGIVALGLLQPLQQALHRAGLSLLVFDQVCADPPDTVVEEALQLARDQGVDGIIGFGGGSSMDTAKLVALLARSGENLEQIYGVEQARGPRLPLVMIPTTAGTGSEVTAVAIVTTGATTKMGVVSSHLFADCAILDAELTLALPPHITAMTGIDAMVHAVEAYTSIHKKNPYTDMLAREALRLLSANLLRATRQGDDIHARQSMLLGACLAGQAFANAPVAAVHALAYPLGGHYHIPHGLSNSLVLPEVLRFNQPAAQSWYAELATLLLEPAHLQPGEAGRSAQLIDYFETLIGELGLPSRLRDAGVAQEDLPMLAQAALQQQRLLVNNPRPLLESDALAIYQRAF